MNNQRTRFVWMLASVFVIPSLLGSNRNLGEAPALESKSEFSVLQYYEHEYRTRDNSISPRIERAALGTNFTVIGLPMKDSATGYVWFVANPVSEPRLKQMPTNAAFSISADDLRKLRSVSPAPKVFAHLSAQVIEHAN